MFAKQGRKQEVAKMQALDPEIAATVPCIHELPEMVEAGKKLRELEAKFKEVMHQLTLNLDGAGAGHFQFGDPEHEAIRLLDEDKSLDELCPQTPQTKRSVLARHRAVLEKAILILKERRRMLEADLIQRECGKLQSIGERFIGDTIRAFEALELCLKRQEVFFQFLSHKGFTSDRRPTGWDTSGYEQRILFGGDGWPTLAWFISERKKVWKLDGKKE